MKTWSMLNWLLLKISTFVTNDCRRYLDAVRLPRLLQTWEQLCCRSEPKDDQLESDPGRGKRR